MAANLIGNSGWKQTPNAAIKQRLNWAVTTGNSTNNSSTVVVSYWLKKNPNIQNLPTTSTNCHFKITCGGQTVSDSAIDQYYNSSMTLPANNTEMCVARHTFTIAHNQDGTKSINIKATGGFGGTSITYYKLSVSKSLTLPSITRASTITSASNVYIGNNVSIKFTPNSKNFYFRLKFVYGSHTYQVGTKSSPIKPNTTSQYTYSGFTVPMELLNDIVNMKSAKMSVYLYTYLDSAYSKKIGTTSNKTFTITVPQNIQPTIISSNGVATPRIGLLLVDGYTDFSFTVVASGAYGSTITKLNAKCKDKTFSSTNIVDNGDNTYTCTLNVSAFNAKLTKDTYLDFDLYVVDSRGVTNQSSGAFVGFQMCAYTKPSIKLFKTERDETNATIINVWLNASGSSLRIQNVIRAIINYREFGTTAWKSAGYIATNYVSVNVNGVGIETADGDIFLENKAYEIQAYIYDSMGNTAVAETYVGVSSVLIDLRAGGMGVGIGKMAESDSVEVALPTKFYAGRKRVINNTEYLMNDMIDSCRYSIGDSALENGFVIYNVGEPLTIRKIGNVVNLCGAITSTLDIAVADMQDGKRFLKLTGEFRPQTEVRVLCQGSGKFTWLLTVKTNGNVTFSRYGKTDFAAVTGKGQTESGRVWLPFNVTYFTDDMASLSIPTYTYVSPSST